MKSKAWTKCETSRLGLIATGVFTGIAALSLSAPVLAQTTGTTAAATTPPASPSAASPASEAPAQTASAAPGSISPATAQEIIVTGFRQSVATALNAKRNEIGAVDVIKSEDIAQFPDNNLAESIQRIPGVTITRAAGEGRSITVRGLGPGFTRVRINGMEAQATSGGSAAAGGINLGRGFDFNVFASELFNSITVRKTQSADVDEGSLGATVDLATAHPFDFKKTTATISAEGQYNDLRGRIDPRLVGLFSTTFGGSDFGLLVSGAYSTSHKYEDDQGGAGGWDTVNTNGGFCSPLGVTPTNPLAGSNAYGSSATQCSTGVDRLPGTASNIAAYQTAEGNGTVQIPHLPRYGRITHDQKRLGLTGSLQWQPSNHTLVTFDALYSQLKETRREMYLNGISFARSLSSNGLPQTSVTDAEVNDAGDLVYGVFDNVDVRSDDRLVQDKTTFQQYTLNFKQDLSDTFHITGLAGYSDSKYSNPVDVTVSMDAVNSDNYSFDYRNNSRLPLITYGFDVTDPNAYSFTSGNSLARVRQYYVDNTFKTGELNGTFDITSDFHFNFGGSYKQFDFKAQRFDRNAAETTVPDLPAGTSLASLTDTVTGFGKGMNLPAGSATSWVTPDPQAFIDAFGILSGQGTWTMGSIDNSGARGGNQSVTEKTKSAYGQFTFDTDFLPVHIRGDVGMRYIDTQQTARGYQLQSGSAALVSVQNDYHKWLPAVNLTADLQQNLLLRFGAARVLARPNLTSLSPGGTILAQGTKSITLGNPQLAPIEASTMDVSLEWYFAPRSILSVAYFHKNIHTFVQTLTRSIPFSETGLPDSLLDGYPTVPSDIFTVSQPVNTPGGPLDGVEVNFQSDLPLNFLPDILNHFGVLANYTYVTSKINYCTNSACSTSVTAELTGLSKNAANATLYYDNGKLSVRGSVAWRSGFLTGVPGGNTGNDVNGTHGSAVVDAQLTYTFNDHLKLKLEGLNLTDTFIDQYQDSDRDSSLDYEHTGRQINFGVQYKF
ncbi:TonB-dependent receptor [Novosphingobium sp. 9]|uniref:TonB-dependent receptor n=1 Tax=Novosphingobium sp. 9 TaxID=2025349 RepID=UPI0021B69582|nr:TonB-dependent receptor [Novosphingobium sp. 9]